MFVFGIVLLLSLVSSSCNEIIISEEKYTRRDAMEFCANRSAHMISSDTAMQIHFNSSDVTWTSNTITSVRPCRAASMTRLCGFTLINHFMGYREGYTLYGDCDALHLYGCKYEKAMPFSVTNCTYDEAMECNYILTAGEVNWLPTGYYWTKQTLFYCTQQTTGMLNVSPNIRHFCGVYGKDFGQAFRNCSEINFVSCTFGNDTFTKQYHPTQISGTGTHLFTKIGVPVGVCLVLVCVVVLVILYVRRGRRKLERRESKYCDSNKTERKTSKLKTCVNNTLQTSVNASQSEPDQSVDNTVRIDCNNEHMQSETNHEYEYLRKTEAGFINGEHEYGDASSNVRDEEFNRSGDDLDNTDICFEKDVDNRTSTKSEDIADHVYANEDNNPYAAVKTKRQEPNNVYYNVS